MSTVRKNNAGSKKSAKSSGNPFIKALEDKRRINKALKEGKDLSTLKGIDFATPL